MTINVEEDWKPAVASGNEPLYLSIVQAMRGDILSGRLRPGDRLPTQRALADALGVGLSTVTRAYKEAARLSLIGSTVGRGTFVRDLDERAWSMNQPQSRPAPMVEMGVDLSMNHLDPDLAPALAEIAADASRRALLENQPHIGMMHHREAGAAWLEHIGVSADPSQVVVTHGLQNALMMSMMLACEPGDSILCGELTYPGLRVAADFLHIKLVPVEQDAGGVMPSAIARHARSPGVRAIFLMPSLENPTTRCLSVMRRDQIAEIADRYGLWVIEDDAHRTLADERLDPVSVRIPDRSLYTASLSKSVAPGLRVGYLVAPEREMTRVSDAAWASSWMGPPLMAEIATRWIHDGTAARIAAAKREEAGRRQRLCAKILEGIPYESQAHSHFIWIPLPEGWTSESFVAEAKRRSAALAISRVFTARGGGFPRAVRACLSPPETMADVERGLRAVRSVLVEQDPVAPRGGVPADHVLLN